MKKKIVYRYFRDDGGTTVSIDKPDCEYTEKYRLVAKKGMVLKKGDLIVPCVDVTDPVNHGWTEIEAPVDEIARRKVDTNEVVDENAATEADYIAALQEMGVEM